MSNNKVLLFSFLFAVEVFLPHLILAGAQSAPTVKKSAPEVVGRIAAVVNNEPIFAEDLEKEAGPFIERFKKSAPEKTQTPEKMMEMKRDILNEMVKEKLVLQEAKNKKVIATKLDIERGIDQFKEPFTMDKNGKPRTPDQIERSFQDELLKEGMTQDDFNQRVKDQILKVKLIETEVKSKVRPPTDEDVHKYFDKIQNRMAGKPVGDMSPDDEADLNQISKYMERLTGKQVRVRDILARTNKNMTDAQRSEIRKKLEDIRERAINKGEDFAYLASKYSDDPVSKGRGGDIGFFSKGDMGLPDLEEVIFKMKEGEISDIVESENGFHLIKMVEIRNPHPVDFEDVKDDLKNLLTQKAYSQKLDEFIDGLRAKASIKINPIE